MDLIYYSSSLLHLVPLLVLIYFYIKRKYSYWSARGIPGPKPSVLKLGNVLQIAGQKSPPEDEIALVQKYGRIYGTYSMFSPTLTIADAEAVKQVLVKDFHHFIDRRKLNTYHELFNIAQFFTEGEHWKRIRSITSPSFTTGKLRAMVPLMDRCGDKLVAYLEKVVKEKSGIITTRPVMAGYTIDVIASTAYATETNTLRDGPDADPLVVNCLALGNISPFTGLCFFTMPRWFNDLVGVRHVLNANAFEYMRQYIQAILKRRQSGAEKRNDLMQLLINASISEDELKSGGYDKLAADMEQNDPQLDNVPSTKTQQSTTILTDNEIISQSMLFFGAGFETTAFTLTHIIFELSQHQDVQEKLVAELTSTLDGLEPTSAEYYDKLMGSSMPYLDAVVKETLRKYPPLVRLERRCALEGYKVGGVTLAKDQLVEVSTYAIHYNPDYYPNPEVFNPDRFLPENKHRLVQYAYLPFGLGPRNCVGMRAAYQNIKLCIDKILRQFAFHPTPRTPQKLEFDQFKFALTSKNFETRVEMRR